MPQPHASIPVARSGIVSLLVHESGAAAAIEANFAATTPEAFDRLRGTRDETQPYGAYRIEGRTALIPVLGSLIPRGVFLGSGYATPYEALCGELRRAGSDAAVDAVALMIDSPGGYVSNLDAAVAAVGRLRESKNAAGGMKTVTAYVQGMACSAAYWIAAACDEIVCSPQAELGSIGVLQAHFDMSGMLEAFGIKVTLLHAGAKKVDGNPYEALSDRVKAEMNQRLEQLRMAFAEGVAAGRPSLDVAAVLATEAATYVGPEAVARGLADRVGFLADDLDDPDELFVTSPFGRFMETSMNYTQAQLDQAVTAARTDGHRAGRDEGLAAGKTEGHATGKAEGLTAGKADGEKAGAGAERERIKAIRGSDEAKKRPQAADHVALTTDMPVDAAKSFLAGLAEEKAETLEIEMAGDKQPLVGADGKPLDPQAGLSTEQKKFAEGEAEAKRLLGKK